MFGEESYSKVVGFLKVTLPLAALALLSTVFLLARAPSPESAIPYAEIEDIAREPRVTGPQFSGVADDGSVINLAARSVKPQGDVLLAEAITANIQTADGAIIDIRAGFGEIDNAANTAHLSGLTHVTTSDGYEMETAGLSANLTTGRLISDGELEAHATFGTLTAGQMIIEPPDADTGQLMLFQNGVRLVYRPQQ